MAVIELFAAASECASRSTDFSLCSFERKTVVIAAHTDTSLCRRVWTFSLRQEGHGEGPALSCLALLHRLKSMLRTESYLPDRDGSPVEEVKRMI
jgi:hypothetical protein